MMDLLLATSGGESQSASGGYVDDVFSAYTYTGNGSTQTISNGIDLAGKGGLIWFKGRNTATDNLLFDTNRGINKSLVSNSTAVETLFANSLTSFNSNGFSIGSYQDLNEGSLPATYSSWTFRKALKFFDVVTYTGDGTNDRAISHNLGVTPGMIVVRRIAFPQSWFTWHSGLTDAFTSNRTVSLNLTNAQSVSIGIFSGSLINNNTLGVSSGINSAGATYVAYLFAHDPSADGIIQCGSYVGNGSAVGQLVTLGWEPQYLMIKNASGTGNWQIIDSMRGTPVGSADATLQANLSNAESSVDYVSPTATGFQVTSTSSEVNTNGSTYIYLAIRRPNKPPTSGTQVYNASTASGVVSAGFPVDLHIGATRTGAASNHAMHTRLTGGTREMVTSSAAAEATITDLGFDGMTGLKASLPSGMVNHFFRRNPGFFDVVCDTGTGVAHAIAHNLTKAPELIIRKSRSAATQWEVWHSALAATEKLVLNSDAAKATDATAWGSTLPTATQFTVGTGANVNASAATFVTYLFATLAGISKCGSYTGNGSSQTINCGFATGARFILIKRTDATGDWYVWDSVRGIIAANDPHLSLNTTAAEVTTDDSVDPDASGFIVNQNTATNVNVNGGQYIFLAIS